MFPKVNTLGTSLCRSLERCCKGLPSNWTHRPQRFHTREDEIAVQLDPGEGTLPTSTVCPRSGLSAFASVALRGSRRHPLVRPRKLSVLSMPGRVGLPSSVAAEWSPVRWIANLFFLPPAARMQASSPCPVVGISLYSSYFNNTTIILCLGRCLAFIWHCIWSSFSCWLHMCAYICTIRPLSVILVWILHFACLLWQDVPISLAALLIVTMVSSSPASCALTATETQWPQM